MRLRGKILAAAFLIAAFGAVMKGAATLPPGFQQTIVFSGLTRPTAVRFAPDGRIFVAEKSGVIKVFDSLTATTPTIFADLTHRSGQLLGPGTARHGARIRTSPTTPYVYVLYAYDVARSPAPRGAGAGTTTCPTPPGPTTNGCVDQRAPVAPDRRRQRA